MMVFEQEVEWEILKILEEHELPFPHFRYYKVGEELQILGKGGFATVYEMVSLDNPDRHYALKVIGMEEAIVSSGKFWDTFKIQQILSQESEYVMRTIAAKELCVIVDEDGAIIEVSETCSDRWQEEGIILQFILMEKLEGIVKRDKFNKMSLLRDQLCEEEHLIQFALEIGKAIEVAHEGNVLHRDIKLENIFWDEGLGCYKLGDFGIAKQMEGGTADTIVFTDGYGAPEIEKKLGHNYNMTADIYSFGITLYLLLNNLKFPGSNGYYVNMIQYDPSIPFPAPEHASEDMARLIGKMCCYKSEDRFQSIRDVLLQLQKIKHQGNEVEEFEEFIDAETETYRECNSYEDEEDAEEEPRTQTRYERKRELAVEKSIYKFESEVCFFLLTVAFVVLFRGMQLDVYSLVDWSFWILPIMVFVEAILIHLKEFHWLFGLITMIVGGYLCIVCGFSAIRICLLLSVLTGVPVIMAACSVGCVLWVLIMITEWNLYTNVVDKYDLTWIALVVIIVIAMKLAVIEIRRMNSISPDKCVFGWLYYMLFNVIFGMGLVGVVLFIIQKQGLVVLPDAIQKLHLIRTSIVTAVICIMFFLNDGEIEELTGD